MGEKCRRHGTEAELNCERAIGLVQQFVVNFRPWRQHLLFFHGVNSFLPGTPIHQTREVSPGLKQKVMKNPKGQSNVTATRLQIDWFISKVSAKSE